ncbi:hypothetical protein [Lysobacter silvisoli]|uniref:Uncharacterized protein n=1 Tax=Lysobacter silvisoli TaxID=2293254 RepID=A0A371JZ29_9GAMM|nr:hypothetical protein [Lysobacter silvisoli]RDZ26860.1 hypothetical protein DX914_11305 [Lysobacter silvisoli]
MTAPAPPAAATPPSRSLASRALAWSLLLLGTLGFAAVWLLLSLYSSRQNSWMAVIAALDLAWMLRLGGWRPGPLRAGLGVAGTAAAIGLYSWGIAATQIGLSLGVGMIDSMGKLGVHHAWLLTQLANGPMDWAWLIVGLVVAAVASR